MMRFAVFSPPEKTALDLKAETGGSAKKAKLLTLCDPVSGGSET